MSLIRMVRDPAFYKKPFTADVDEAEIDNYRPGGFVLVSEATFAVPDVQLDIFGDEVRKRAEEAAANAPRNEQGLRLDGPTLEEYVAAGYAAESYPPRGYAVKSTADANPQPAGEAKADPFGGTPPK